MMMMKTIAAGASIAALSLAAVPAAAHDAPIRHVHAGSTMPPSSESFDAIWHQDIPYASAPDTDPLLLSLDIYTLDPAPTGVPVMVYVHGGGGRRGDKAWPNDIASKPAHFLQRERFVFVSVNYRLGDAGQYPVAHQDVANALAWVHDHIAQYGGDPNRIFLSGHSSGAALVARVSTMDDFLKNAGKDLSLVKGAITIDGGNFDARTDPSPIQSVARGRYLPPFLLLHIGNGGGSEKDALAMAAAMRDAGHRADVVDLLGKDHFSASSDIGRYNDPATTAVQRFLASLTGTAN